MKLYISVFSDSRAPVSKKRVTALLRAANLRLAILGVELIMLNYYPNIGCKKLRIGYVRQQVNDRKILNYPSSTDVHLRMFVTDRNFMYYDKRNAATLDDVKFGHFLGHFGGDMFALYGIKTHIRELDSGRNNLAVTAFLHELGHFFELDHTDDPNFLMHTRIAKTQGRWHPEEQKIIQKTIRKIQKKLATTR